MGRGLTPDGVVWAFSTFYDSNWHPLTWLSHMLDCQLFGLDPGPHHLVNLFWHVANAILLLLLLDRLTGSIWRSGLVAALFALHPLHVESVAWVAERKDVLSTFFGLVAIGFYADWTRRGRCSQYALSLVAYASSLMSKPMLVTLPFLFLLLDLWPLGRAFSVPRTRLFLEKLPFFALSVASCAVAYLAQQLGGAVVPTDVVPILFRLANTAVSYADYLRMMIWPVDLAVFYPFHLERISAEPIAASVALLVLISAVALWLGRRRPALAIGWLWYLGTLVPVIGLVQVGAQAKADRYTYFPSIGIFLMLAWSLPSLRALRPSHAVALGSAALVAIASLAWRAHVQVGYWSDTVTLFDHAIAVTRANYRAHVAKGDALAFERHWTDEAIAEYREALRIKPRFHLAKRHLADALLEKRELAEAVALYQSLLELVPDSLHERQNLAAALVRMGRPAEAVPHFEAALRIQPRLREAHIGLGMALEQTGRTAEAIEAYERAVALLPADAELHRLLGDALANQRRPEEAAHHLREALRLRPGLAAARASLDRLESQRAPEEGDR